MSLLDPRTLSTHTSLDNIDYEDILLSLPYNYLEPTFIPMDDKTYESKASKDQRKRARKNEYNARNRKHIRELNRIAVKKYRAKKDN